MNRMVEIKEELSRKKSKELTEMAGYEAQNERPEIWHVANTYCSGLPGLKPACGHSYVCACVYTHVSTCAHTLHPHLNTQETPHNYARTPLKLLSPNWEPIIDGNTFQVSGQKSLSASDKQKPRLFPP